MGTARFGLALTVFLALGARSGIAHAQCAEECKIDVTPELSPELPCVSFDVDPDSCNCGFELSVKNGCQYNLSFTEPFDRCTPPVGAATQSCSTLQANWEGLKKVALPSNGDDRRLFSFQGDGLSYTITIRHEQSPVDEGCGCAAVGRQRADGAAWSLLGLGLLGCALGRRRLRSARR